VDSLIAASFEASNFAGPKQPASIIIRQARIIFFIPGPFLSLSVNKGVPALGNSGDVLLCLQMVHLKLEFTERQGQIVERFALTI
jgi:hypothetical protein